MVMLRIFIIEDIEIFFMYIKNERKHSRDCADQGLVCRTMLSFKFRLKTM